MSHPDPQAHFDVVSAVLQGIGKPKGLDEDTDDDATDTLAGWIEALSIFGSYNPGASIPMTGGHDVVWISVSPEKVSAEHKARLAELGWNASSEFPAFESYQNS